MGCTHSRAISVVPGPTMAIGPTIAATAPAKVHRRRQSRIASFISGRKRERGKRFNREERQMVKKYLPTLQIYEYSTPAHLATAAAHWNNIYKEGSQANVGSKRSQNSWGQENKQSSALRDLYAAFYSYLEAHYPEIMFIFRSSLQVRGRVLVHISAGMRSILAASDAPAVLARLTRTHIAVGVKYEHFHPLAESLFYGFAQTAGPSWTPEVEEAWKRLFVHVSALLMVDQKKAASQGPRSILSLRSKKSNSRQMSSNSADVFRPPASTNSKRSQGRQESQQ